MGKIRYEHRPDIDLKDTKELITLEKFIENMEIEKYVEVGVPARFDRDWPKNILGIAIYDVECPYGEPVGEIRFEPVSFNGINIFSD